MSRVDTFRRRQHDAADIALSLGDDVDEGLAVEAQRHGPAQVRVVKGRRIRVDDQVTADIRRVQLAKSLRRLICYVPRQRYRQPAERDVELAGNKCQHRRRHVADDRIFDAIKVRPAGFPVIGIAYQLDRLVRLELDKFERPRADWMLAHVTRRYMAGVDRRKPGGEQGNKGGLRPLQYKRRFVIPVGGDLLEVAVPGLPRIDTQLLARLALQQVPGALDILGGQRLAVVPLDALVQLEGQPGAVLVPRPALGQFGHDRLHAVLLHVLVVQNEVVKHPHHRAQRKDGGFFVDRHAGRAVDRVGLQYAALFLG